MITTLAVGSAILLSVLTHDVEPSQLVWWIPSACDTLSAETEQYTISFEVQNRDPYVQLFNFWFQALTETEQMAGSCPIVACEAPTNWVCYLDPNNPYVPAAWGSNEAGKVLPGQTLSGFSITVANATCCFEVLADDVIFNIVARDTICAPCDAPVQTMGTTWGRVKSIYR